VASPTAASAATPLTSVAAGLPLPMAKSPDRDAPASSSIAVSAQDEAEKGGSEQGDLIRTMPALPIMALPTLLDFADTHSLQQHNSSTSSTSGSSDEETDEVISSSSYFPLCRGVSSERRGPVVVLLAGTSGGGKSTLASLLAERLGMLNPMVLGTDMVRHALREAHPAHTQPLLHVSTYQTDQVLMQLQQKQQQQASTDRVAVSSARAATVDDADPCSPSSLHRHQLLLEGYKAQSRLVLQALRPLLLSLVRARRSVVVEGVHLLPEALPALMQGVPEDDVTVVPFLVYVSDEQRHRDRLAARAQRVHRAGWQHQQLPHAATAASAASAAASAFAASATAASVAASSSVASAVPALPPSSPVSAPPLSPSSGAPGNKYLASFSSIRCIQTFLLAEAAERRITCIDNANDPERSVADIALVLKSLTGSGLQGPAGWS